MINLIEEHELIDTLDNNMPNTNSDNAEGVTSRGAQAVPENGCMLEHVE
jgi:hypothetical protein